MDAAPGGWGRSQQQTCIRKGVAFSSRREFCSERDWTGLRVDSTVGEGIRFREQACFFLAPPSSQGPPFFSLPQAEEAGGRWRLPGIPDQPGQRACALLWQLRCPTVLRLPCGPGFSLELDASNAWAGAQLKKSRVIQLCSARLLLPAAPTLLLLPALLPNTQDHLQTTHLPRPHSSSAQLSSPG